MKSLSVWSACLYLTTIEGGTWREEDWTANRIVKCMKDRHFNGRFSVNFGGDLRYFDYGSREDAVTLLIPDLAHKMGELMNGQFSIVPIPNSAATVDVSESFRTEYLARRIADHLHGRAVVAPLLRWKQQFQAARRGGPRDPDILFNNLAFVSKPPTACLIFDDVMTSGGHMAACYRRLIAAGISPSFGLVIGRSTQWQQPNPIGWREEILEIEP
jgi:hypothetical protein